MRAIKIDVVNKDIYEIDIEPGSLDDIYKHLECRVFTMPYEHLNRDGLYIDDEGLLVNPESIKGGFAYRHFPHQPLFGNGLIIGCDEAGESDNAKTSLDQVKHDVVFVPIDLLIKCQEDLTREPFKITCI